MSDETVKKIKLEASFKSLRLVLFMLFTTEPPGVSTRSGCEQSAIYWCLPKGIAVPENGIDHGIVPFVVPLFPTDKRKPHRVSFASISRLCLNVSLRRGLRCLKPPFFTKIADRLRFVFRFAHRPGRSGHLLRAVCHGPAVRHGDVIHRDGEADG